MEPCSVSPRPWGSGREVPGPGFWLGRLLAQGGVREEGAVQSSPSFLGCRRAGPFPFPKPRACGQDRQPALALGSALCPRACLTVAVSPRNASPSWTVRLDRSGLRLCRSRSAWPATRTRPCSCCRRWALGGGGAGAGAGYTSPLTWSPPLLAPHAFLIPRHVGLVGEGETYHPGKKVPLAHGGQALSEGHVDPQRGNVVRSAQLQAWGVSGGAPRRLTLRVGTLSWAGQV